MTDNVEEEVTPLMAAARDGLTQEVRRLIAMGADVNSKTSSGVTPLMYASEEGHEEVVRVLLAGAHVDDEDCDGSTALMAAACWGHCGVVR